MSVQVPLSTRDTRLCLGTAAGPHKNPLQPSAVETCSTHVLSSNKFTRPKTKGGYKLDNFIYRDSQRDTRVVTEERSAARVGQGEGCYHTGSARGSFGVMELCCVLNSRIRGGGDMNLPQTCTSPPSMPIFLAANLEKGKKATWLQWLLIVRVGLIPPPIPLSLCLSFPICKARQTPPIA